MKDGQPARLGRGGNQEIGDLAAALVLGGEQTLNLSASLHVIARRLHELKGTEGLRQLVPLGSVASRIADLQITDSSRASAEQLAAAPDGEPCLVLATGRYVGEGFDEPRLDTLLLAMPVAWKGTVVQYAGRLHRAFPGKRDALVYDYVDAELPVLRRMFAKRLKAYRSLGYEVEEPQSSLSSARSQ